MNLEIMLKQSKDISRIYFIIDDYYMHNYDRIKEWFFTPHQHFDGKSPMDLIQAGKAKSVLDKVQMWLGR